MIGGGTNRCLTYPLRISSEIEEMGDDQRAREPLHFAYANL